MIILQPTRGKPFFSQKYTFEGSDYILRFEWNSRAGWFLGVDSFDGPIFHPRALVLRQDLLANHRHDPRCPPGRIVALDLSGADAEPGYEDLATGATIATLTARVILLYIPSDEIRS